MSQAYIQEYYREVERVRAFGATANESSMRAPFQTLLKRYADSQQLTLIHELTVHSRIGTKVRPDGTLVDEMRLERGHWESKDEKDDLDEEIRKKLDLGYPNSNILFEDGQTAVLIQNGREVMRAAVADADRLHAVLEVFTSYEPPEVESFRLAIERFGADIPAITVAIHERIQEAHQSNRKFRDASRRFTDLCRRSIKPTIGADEVHEMILQHVLTADLFTSIFDEPQFHRENNIAQELERVVGTFLVGDTRRQLIGSIRHYYEAIKAAAAQIADHNEKQRFLKVVYEAFYKSYNPKDADKLGVVYTPNEVVDFMIKATDELLFKHFGRFLKDDDVRILDPATGTGTFICDIINYLPADRVEHKYRHELFANEVAILPYYIANLNIEFTFRQKVKRYIEFPNLCFVDTIDNYAFGGEGEGVRGAQGSFAFTMSEENTERIERQNSSKISVIIGNPPYNANQMNENDNNRNREYPAIDGRIRETFVKLSEAQKTKMYDMYSRFYRWAFDRVEKQGIVAYVTNRSFIDSRSFDGFRKAVAREFDFIYIIDTHSDVRANPKISGSKHNIFKIQTGVAVLFLIRMDRERSDHHQARIEYHELPDTDTREQKLSWFAMTRFREISFRPLWPDSKAYWFPTQGDAEWKAMTPVADKLVKQGHAKENAIFQLYSLGVATNRDDWVYNFSKIQLVESVKFFIKFYNSEAGRWKKHKSTGFPTPKAEVTNFVDRKIKWTAELEKHMVKGNRLEFDESKIIPSLYRPFVRKLTYFARIITHRFYQFDSIPLEDNLLIAFSGVSSHKPFHSLASNQLVDLHLTGDTQCVPLYRTDKEGRRRVNILDWAISRFRERYAEQDGERIGPEEIFAYVYAALHHPGWRQRFAQHLKRDLPRIPFYADFWAVQRIGQRLIDLHAGFDKLEPWPLERYEGPPLLDDRPPRALLKADRKAGVVALDERESLRGFPPEAWDYVLGNRPALEWVLDQYRENKIKDRTVAEQFPPYRFADHKEDVILLLGQVCRASVETVQLLGELGRQEPF